MPKPVGDGAVNAGLNEQMMRRVLEGAPQQLTEQDCALRVLEVRGRVSGLVQRTPIGVVVRDAQPHAVCPDRGRDWARNLMARRRCTLAAGGERSDCEAVPILGEAAASVVAAYLDAVRIPWVRDAFGLGLNPTHEQIRAQVHRMAVFRLIPESTALSWPDVGEPQGDS